MFRRAPGPRHGAAPTRCRARVLPALLAAIGAVASSYPALPADAPKAKLPAVTVQSARELRRQVDRFVTAEVFQPPGEPIMRWDTPVCPFVQGLPVRFNDFVQDRIARIAASAHVTVAGKQCEPNLYVFATPDPDRLVAALLQQNPRMLASGRGMGNGANFVHSQRPVRVWYDTESHCRDVTASVALSSKGPGTGSRIDDMSDNICSDADTRLTYASTNSMSFVYIVVDLNRVKEVTTRQLADYVAMIGLAHVRPDADAGTVPTILRLFRDPAHPPQAMSAWDQALLHSLYTTDQSSTAQLLDMKADVLQEIAGAHTPEDVAASPSGSSIPAWANELVPQRNASTPYWYRVGAEQGSAAAQYDLGVINLQGQGVPKDYAAAAQWFSKAAKQGHVAAQYNLGAMYMLGEGVSQDYGQAAQWFRKAAEQGNADAQSRLGSAYASGQGVPLDYAQAVRWYRSAAEQGNTAGQYDLAVMYLLGRGVQQNYANAAQWFRKAAEGGDVNAQRNLGLAYVKGRGLPRDYVQGALWFRKAAEQGDADSQFYLGNMFNSGLGVQQDPVQAYEWWMLAKADSSSSDDTYGRSVFKMKVAASRLTSDQMAHAQQEASAWLAAHRASSQRLN